MSTKTKNLWRKATGFAIAAAMLASAVPMAGMLAAHAYGSSEEVAAEESNVLTSNLILDGGFENVEYNEETKKIGAWDVDLASEAAGTGGTVALVEDSGGKALRLKSPGNKSGYPEISQTVTVLPNTAYYVTMRVRVDYLNAVFFGIASPERAGETIYGQLHRWNDTSIDKDHDTEDTKLTIEDDKFSGYSTYSAHFTTGNETAVRLFIREEKSDIIVDDVSMTYEGNLIPAASKNLLANGGFEESTGAEPLRGWKVISNTAEVGSEIGIDALDVSTYMRSTQDKQMEGLNTLYLAAKEGFTEDDDITFGQAVEVKANTNYTFSVNLSKYGDAKRAKDEETDVTASGIQTVTVGIGYYEGEEFKTLVTERIDGSNISLAAYRSFGVMTNTGEHTEVYPFVKMQSAAGGQWGNCLYVDDCLFFEHALDLPEGKQNLLQNGGLSGNDDDWYYMYTGEAGWQNSSPYLGGSVWAKEWYPYSGIIQSTNLKKDSLYKVTANIVTYLDNWQNSGVHSPVSILVIEGNDSAVRDKINGIVTNGFSQWSDLSDINIVARQNVTVSTTSNWFYHPVNLIFSVPEDGEYSILICSEYGAYDVANNAYFSDCLGGMNIGSVTMYETSLAELSPVKETTPADVLGTIDPDNITIGEEIAVANGMPVSHFVSNVYGYGTYTLKVVDAEGNEVTSGNMQATYKVLVFEADGEEPALTFAVSVSEKQFSSEGTQGGTPGETPGGSEGGSGENQEGMPAYLIAIIVCAAVIGVAVVAAVVILLVKKKKSDR